MMGSGGMIVLDSGTCMVDLARFFLAFTADESCGKCAPCRIGGTQILRILNRFAKNEGRQEDFATIKRLAHAMQKASLCGLGQTAPNPVLSALKYFESELQEKCVPA